MSFMDDILQKSPYKFSTSKEPSVAVRTALQHVTTFKTLQSAWDVSHGKGCCVARRIKTCIINLASINEGHSILQSLSDELTAIGDYMKIIVEDMDSISQQMNALAKLRPFDEPFIDTWSANKLASHIESICVMYRKELELKLLVVGNKCKNNSSQQCPQ